MQILVVDDDLVTQELLQCTLEEMGHEVLTANNGVEACENLSEGTCRLVITDWQMPGMDGLELCRTIRAGDWGGYIYIILLTSREGTSNIVEGLTAGADDFMSKPFDVGELRVRVRSGERVLNLESRNMVIFALAKLAESRDTDTGQHLERVRVYAQLLARDLYANDVFPGQIDGSYIQMIYATSPLHDIGKVALPDHVLLKPGRLDEREYSIMQTHTTAGAETLESALRHYPDAGFLRMARDIALSHHERIDGHGYPEKLAGDEIPLCARIFAIADVYDALVSKRVYKEMYSHDVARSIITEGNGTQFDSRVVQAFLRCEDSFRQVMAGQKTQDPSPQAENPDPALV